MTDLGDDEREFENLLAWIDQEGSATCDFHEISQRIKAFRSLLQENQDSQIAKQPWWEQNAFDLEYHGSLLGEQMSGTYDNGSPFSYPDLSKLEPAAFDYFAERLAHVTDPFLQARYAYILWQSPNKRVEHAMTAAQAYLEQIPILEARESTAPEDHPAHHLVIALKSAFQLLSNIKAKAELQTAKNEILRVLTTFPESSGSWFYVRFELLTFIIENWKLSSYEEVPFLPQFCLDSSDKVARSHTDHAITFLELGHKVDAKLGSKTCNWQHRIAEHFEELMERWSANAGVASVHCSKALEHYRLSGNDEKVTLLKRKREELAGRLQLETISTPIDLTEHAKWSLNIAEQIILGSSEEVIMALIIDKVFLPDPDRLKTNIEKHRTDFPLLSLIPESRLDSRGNLVKHVEGEDDKERAALLREFGFYLHTYDIHLIHTVIHMAMDEEKLSADTVIKYLTERSWYGHDLEFMVANQVHKYRWIDILEPGIRAYFEVLEQVEGTASAHPSLVLCIDSLSMKFEGLIRDLCNRNGIITTLDNQDSHGKTITQERDLNSLIRVPKIAELLGEQDHLFLQYLLVEKLGMNLRNEVAHCLMHREDYTLSVAHWVFLGILRLGKFKLSQATENNPAISS